MRGRPPFPLIRADHQAIVDCVPNGARVLDVGCGDGALLSLLKGRKQADARGLELSGAGVEACLKLGLSVIQGDADIDLEVFPDNGFDIAIASKSLQSLQRPAYVLGELARIAPEIIISFRNYGHWRRRLNLLVSGRMPAPRQGHWHDPEALHPSSLADMLDLAGAIELDLVGMARVSGERISAFRNSGTWRTNLFAEDAILHLRRR